ncbi:hypothetical protein K5M76_09445 [Shewanella xiamenensis]|uniref:hypothetical protein n=1 Tax=Shewanella xiamenensis TaxID=332186 RepID=UPI00217CCF8C|nr:hypothetical protein [Shewanella xiamenensis]MCT8857568.1 hypothetical protein [Shewanella xiamenensis]UWG66413.1 hypothetical protein K5M76_09445 [Shewanella xiamenensis]
MTNLLTNELLDYIGVAVEVTLVGLLIVHVVWLRRLSSESIAVVVFLVVQSLGVILKYPIRGAISSYDVDVGRLVFYMTFAFIDIISVVMIYKLHSFLNQKFSSCAKYLAFCLQSFAMLQIVRLLDRQIGPDLLGLIYKYSIPSMNVSILIVMIFFTVKLIQHQKGFSGIRGI